MTTHAIEPAVQTTPDFPTLFGLFPDDGVPGAQPVAALDVPSPYRRLLVHPHHMTVTVEQFYGDKVNVRVLDTRTEQDEYSRKILLALKGSGKVVQFGIVRIDLNQLSPVVREKIVEGKTPLGRVLIEHNVLTQIHPTEFVKVSPNATLRGWFHMTKSEPLYGRLGVIAADGRPAIEVLEILAPIEELT